MCYYTDILCSLESKQKEKGHRVNINVKTKKMAKNYLEN